MISLTEVVELMLEVSLLMGTPLLGDIPDVHELSPNQIAKVCSRPAKGCYLRPSIYIRDDLKTGLEKNGVLVHELVHHYQEMLGKYNNFSPCYKYKYREEDAYYFQNSYLEKNNSATYSITPQLICPP